MAETLYLGRGSPEAVCPAGVGTQVHSLNCALWLHPQPPSGRRGPSSCCLQALPSADAPACSYHGTFALAVPLSAMFSPRLQIIYFLIVTSFGETFTYSPIQSRLFTKSHSFIPLIQYFLLLLLGEYVIFSVLSHGNKNLTWGTDQCYSPQSDQCYAPCYSSALFRK